MEGDFIRQRHSLKMSQDFNPRPPWGGRHSGPQIFSCRAGRFQSTPSVGRATIGSSQSVIAATNFNPRPPWGGRQSSLGCSQAVYVFQSTPSVGRATFLKMVKDEFDGISIHALRGEGDMLMCLLQRRHNNFNPRPPWGGRPYVSSQPQGLLPFQSTPSVGRATTSFRR